jgi:hypothetical protein
MRSLATWTAVGSAEKEPDPLANPSELRSPGSVSINADQASRIGYNSNPGDCARRFRRVQCRSPTAIRIDAGELYRWRARYPRDTGECLLPRGMFSRQDADQVTPLSEGKRDGRPGAPFGWHHGAEGSAPERVTRLLAAQRET